MFGVAKPLYIMTKEQEVYLGMFLTFENTVTVHQAALVKWPEILAARDLISSKKGVISALSIVQSRGTATETGFKAAIREKLNGEYATVVKAIEGNMADDAGLQARYKNIRPSDLKSKRDTEVESAVLMVVEDAKKMLAKLERSEITEAQLEEMKVLAANYSKAIGEKGSAGDLANLATADLDKVFGEVNEALRTLDGVIKGMPDSKSVERAALQKAREIKNA